MIRCITVMTQGTSAYSQIINSLWSVSEYQYQDGRTIPLTSNRQCAAIGVAVAGL